MASRVLAFLFTDLVGSTEMLASLGDVEGEAMLHAHFRGLRDAVAAHDGREIKSLGDGLMVAFESPSHAVACAVAMQRSVDLANRRDGGGGVAMRVGIQVGEAIEGDEAEPDYLGSPVVQAKRLCDAAQGGQILVSDLVGALAAARSPYPFVPLSGLELKGWPEPINALEVEWEPASRSQLPLPPFLVHRAPPSPFVGRTPQYEALRRFWIEAAGNPRIALLAGEPGIGKTRLAGRFALDLHAEGATVLWGRSAEEALVPYQPFVQALDHYVSASELDQLRDELGASAPDLARFLPALRERLSGLVARPAEDPESDRARFFGAVSSLLSRVSATGTVLLVLDDLHWADQGTLLLLHHLARTPERLSMLVLGTYRDTEVSGAHPLGIALADLRREVTLERIELAGLTEDDVGALLELLLGQTPPPEVTRELVAETQGNPFYLEEIVRHLGEAGALDGGGEVSIDDVGVPESVRDVLLRRMRRLSGGAQEAISTASVIGSEFPVAVLARMLGLDVGSLVPALDEAVEARLIIELPDRVGRYGFPHALVQHTLYESFSANTRALLHASAGTAIEEVCEADLARHYADLARHFSLAGDHEAAKVIRYGRAAGERALELLAYEDAVRELERALAALELSRAGETAARAELLVLLGTALTRAGEQVRAREAFHRAAEVASAVGAGQTLAHAALGYGGGAGFGGVWVTFAAVDETLVSMLERALMAHELEGLLRVRLLGRLAQANYWAPDRLRSVSLSAEALEFARRLGDRAAIAYALDSRHVALWGPDHLDERISVAEEMLRLGRELDDRDIQLEAYAWLITNSLETGPIELVDRYIDAHARVADELRQPYHRWYTFVVRAMRAFMQGRYAEMERMAAAAWQQGEHAHPENAVQVNTLLTLFRLLEGDQVGTLVDGLAAYVESSPLPAWHSGLAMAYAEVGRFDDAMEQVQTFVSTGLDTIPRDCVWYATTAMLTRALVRLDAPALCRDLYDLMLPFEDRNSVVGGAVLTFGPIAGLLGALAGACEEHDRALEHLAAAAERSRALGSEPLTARCELNTARVLLARGASGDADDAIRLLMRVTKTAEAIGMPRLLREVAELG